MFAEAIAEIGDLAVKAGDAKIVLDDPRQIVFLVDGKPLPILKPPAPRKHQVETLDDVIALAKRFDDDGTRPVVWYDFGKVVLVIDDDGHRIGTATLNLAPTETFSLLMELRRAPAWYELKPFIRLLRISLAGTMEPFELLEKVRKLRFENGSIRAVEVNRNRESLGTEIVSKVDGTGDIPETVNPSTRIWTNQGEDERFAVSCAVETDPAMGKLQLLPLPDEIERVKNLAIIGLAGRLRDGLGDVPCYFGRP